MSIDTKRLASRLSTIESIAWIPTVTSTNDIARHVIVECVESELNLPSAIIIANEQRGGRGRGGRTWFSPAGRGIYCTTLHTRAEVDLVLLPLEIAVTVARFLEEVYAITPRLKWPNDVLVNRSKIGGILIEGRSFGRMAYLAIGIGLNVLPLPEGGPGETTSVAEESRRDAIDLTSATEAFVEVLDSALSDRMAREDVLEQWRQRSIHSRGDRIDCLVGVERISGSWYGIDEMGRAVLTRGAERVTISAGDLIFAERPGDH